jgi:hypothetical protein
MQNAEHLAVNVLRHETQRQWNFIYFFLCPHEFQVALFLSLQHEAEHYPCQCCFPPYHYSPVITTVIAGALAELPVLLYTVPLTLTA